MTAKEFLRKEEYTEEDQGEGYILTIQEMADLMEEYAKQKVAEAEETAFKAGWYMGCQLNDCDMKKCEKMFKGWRENK